MSKEKQTTVAAVQTHLTTDTKDNVSRLTFFVEQAAKQGAQVICLPELFESVYFCTYEKDEYFRLAQPLSENASLKHFQAVARKLKLAMPVSLFE